MDLESRPLSITQVGEVMWSAEGHTSRKHKIKSFINIPFLHSIPTTLTGKSLAAKD